MNESVFQRLTQLLDSRGVKYEVLRHAPVYTSAEAAEVRGVSLASGAKALVCKADGRFVMFVMPADRRLASKKVRRDHGIKSLRFANRLEVLECTGLAPGSIPPLGSLFALPTWCDEGLAEQEKINFNAGDHAVSVSLTFDDFVAVEQPKMGSFAQ